MRQVKWHFYEKEYMLAMIKNQKFIVKAMEIYNNKICDIWWVKLVLVHEVIWLDTLHQSISANTKF